MKGPERDGLTTTSPSEGGSTPPPFTTLTKIKERKTMDKNKAKIITAAVMLMLAAIAWMTLNGSIHAFRVIEAFFAVYGFFRFGCDLYHWMQIPERMKMPQQGRRVRG